MRITARAPGKLVVLGEYAVLDGAAALVMAVDRYCFAELAPADGETCRITVTGAATRTIELGLQAHSGLDVVDAVLRHWPAQRIGPWRAQIDSSALHARGGKLGLGSSAASIAAWAGAWTAYTGRGVLPRSAQTVAALVGLHRGLQSGAGSGIDVAASVLGGVLQFRLDGPLPEAVSVRLPDGVRFVGVSTAEPSSTPDLLGRFEAWRVAQPSAAEDRIERMRRTADQGMAALGTADAGRFLEAVQRYGHELEALGGALHAEVVTPLHASIAALARRYGVTYKISGAGGGDVGLGLSTDAEALEAFAASLPNGCSAMALDVDTAGLVTESEPDE